jgi:hypothetical protein
MGKAITGSVMVVLGLLGLLSCSGPPQPIPEENAAIEAVQKVREAYESKVSLPEFQQRLRTAAEKIAAVKTSDAANPCFLNAIDKCYSSYEIGQKAWKMRDEAETETRRNDLDTTLSFTMGFASVSLAQANECFQSN